MTLYAIFEHVLLDYCGAGRRGNLFCLPLSESDLVVEALVDAIEHYGTIDDGQEAWNMLNKNGQEIAFGIYIYHVEAPEIGEKIGKFAVIK